MSHDWMDEASCLGADPALFFPDRVNGNRDYAEARKVCAGCPVRVQCLEAAMEAHEWGSWTGIWGGKSPKERRQIAKGTPRKVRRCSCGRVIQAGVGRTPSTCHACRDRVA